MSNKKFTRINWIWINHALIPNNKKQHVEKCLMFFEIMLNSEPFKDFILSTKFTEESLSSKEIYEKIKSHKKINLTLRVEDHIPRHNRPFTVRDNEIIVYHKCAKCIDVAKDAAILAHEWGHIIGFHHEAKPFGTYLGKIQFEGKILFDKYVDRVDIKKLHYGGQRWMVEEPLFGFLWFWKILKFYK